MRYTRLLGILAKKERIHYGRLGKCFMEMNWAGKILTFPIIAFLITILHYMFATMHLMFETCMYLFNRGQFEKNIVSMEKSIAMFDEDKK